MHRSMVVPTTTLALVLAGLGSIATAAASEAAAPAGSSAALLEALSRVPDSPAAREGMVSYLDHEAVPAARPGAARPASIDELEALLEADDPSADLWWAAVRGISSGDVSVLPRPDYAGGWPAALGFDPLDIDRQITFGSPPADGLVLLGDFEPDAVTAAFVDRGYTGSAAGGRTLLCGAAGCEGGMKADLASADRSLPFGAEIGRSEPLAVSERDILNSADIGTLDGMLAAAEGSAASLADDPAYRAVASAGDPEELLIQATLLPGGMLGLGPDIYRWFSESPEEAGALVVELDEMFEPMPAADAIAIIDGATPTEQVLTLALAYGDEADAAAAAEILPRRLATLPVLSYDVALSDLLTERGVTSIGGSVLPPGDASSAAAVVELRAPLAGSEPDPETGELEASSALYRLFIGMVHRRDLLWLAPVLPLE